MKITTRRLKEIIKEEMQRLDEMAMGRHMHGATHDTATAFGNKDEEEFRAMVNELIGRRGMPARALHRIIDEVESGHTSEEDSGAYWEKRDSMAGQERQKYDPSFPESKYPPMQEAYTRTKKRRK